MENQTQTAAPPSVGPGQIKPALILDDSVLHDKLEIVTHILSGLAEQSDQAAIICPPEFENAFASNGQLTKIIHPAYKLFFLWKQNRAILINKLTDFKPDVIHCLSAKKSKLAASLARQLNVPYIVNIDSSKEKPYILPDYCAKIIATCKGAFDVIKQRKHFKYLDKVTQLNYSTFVEEDCACFDNSNTLTSMILVSDFNNLDRIEPLLNAIRHLAIDGYEFILFLIGAGRAELKVRRLLKSLGLSNIVNVVPPMNPVREIFKEGDIFIHPEPDNRFNPYLLEAMSVGMAVTGCKGKFDDLMVQDKTATLFDPQDEFSIYSTLQKMLDKREVTRKIAKNAQENLRKNHSVSGMLESILNLYNQTKTQFEEKQKDSESS